MNEEIEIYLKKFKGVLYMLNFCEHCRADVQYNIKKFAQTENIKGIAINYIAKEAYCAECGEEIFVDEIMDYNLEMMDTAYRKEAGLISVSEIKQIIEKYDIQKRPLSKLLGWGEVTLTRYLDGDIPSKRYSDVLRQILNDPNEMLKYLEENYSNISSLAYKKCKAAIIEQLALEENGSVEFIDEISKVESVVKYLLVKSEDDITPLALQKLLYYIQGFSKAFTDNFLFDADCEAWVHGPVYREVYEKYRDYGCNKISEDIDIDESKLTEIEKSVIDAVIDNFGCYSGKILERMTHTETPWRLTRGELSSMEPSDKIIKKEFLEEYFISVKSKYTMINISDMSDYSTDIFKKVKN